jgi:hypothetical protein
LTPAPCCISASGNLPRNSTAPEIAAWFEERVEARPSVRLLTSKPAPGAPSSSGPGESRGIAFIECVFRAKCYLHRPLPLLVGHALTIPSLR